MCVRRIQSGENDIGNSLIILMSTLGFIHSETAVRREPSTNTAVLAVTITEVACIVICTISWQPRNQQADWRK